MENNENDNVGQQIGALLTGLAALHESGFISESNVVKANTLIGKFLDKAEVCIDKLDLCPEDTGSGCGCGGNDGGDQPKPLAFVGFSLNLYSETSEGAKFVVTVDGEEFLVDGAAAMSGVDMHLAMINKLSNHPNFILKSFPENGSPTNYAYVLEEKVSGSLFGKQVTVSVSGAPAQEGVPGASSFFWGNITINGVNTDQLPGTGQFIYTN